MSFAVQSSSPTGREARFYAYIMMPYACVLLHLYRQAILVKHRLTVEPAEAQPPAARRGSLPKQEGYSKTRAIPKFSKRFSNMQIPARG